MFITCIWATLVFWSWSWYRNSVRSMYACHFTPRTTFHQLQLQLLTTTCRACSTLTCNLFYAYVAVNSTTESEVSKLLKLEVNFCCNLKYVLVATHVFFFNRTAPREGETEDFVWVPAQVAVRRRHTHPTEVQHFKFCGSRVWNKLKNGPVHQPKKAQ